MIVAAILAACMVVFHHFGQTAYSFQKDSLELGMMPLTCLFWCWLCILGLVVCVVLMACGVPIP